MSVTIHALIVAAGRGSRFGAKVAKQYLTVGGKSILEHSITAICQLQPASLGLVVAQDDERARQLITKLADVQMQPSLQLITGGAERFDSVRAGVMHIATYAQTDDWVMIHDAARPCVNQAILDKVSIAIADLADEVVGVILATPVADTLKYVIDYRISHTQDRTALWAAQTPQVYRLGALLEMYDALHADPLLAAALTDEAAAFERLGRSVAVIASDPTNIKLTHPQDVALITAILAAQGRI